MYQLTHDIETGKMCVLWIKGRCIVEYEESVKDVTVNLKAKLNRFDLLLYARSSVYKETTLLCLDTKAELIIMSAIPSLECSRSWT